MAPESQEQQNNGSTDETPGQEQQEQQQANQGETPKEEQQKPLTIDDSTKLPASHPLVKTLALQKDTLKTQASELAEARSKAAKATQLEEELGKRPTTEAMETLQKRNERLEAFLSAVGGPLSRALDSRTFTRDLFETDKDIAQLVKDWHRANPSATSEALGNAPAGDGKSKPTPNELIRIAAGK